jgi:hypothetical protein
MDARSIARSALLFWLSSCAPSAPTPDGGPSVDASAPADSGADTAVVFDATGVDPRFAPVAAVLVETCGSTYCHHGDGSTPASRNLSAQHIQRTLGLRSLQIPRLRLVEPGQPAQSYLLHKLAGSHSALPECLADAGTCGQRMPSPDQPLTPERIELVRQWITDGAPGL